MKYSLYSILTAALLFTTSLTQCSYAIGAEKTATFYPTYAYQVEDSWHVPVLLWVHEPADMAGRGLAKIARGALAKRSGLMSLTATQKNIYESRVESFIADSESREKVYFAFDQDPNTQPYLLRNSKGRHKTDRNGRIEGELILPKANVDVLLSAQSPPQPELQFSTVEDKYHGKGIVRLISPVGLSIISDIDDTIKITEILAGESTVLRNTFFKPFATIPCMAGYYQDLQEKHQIAKHNTAFHYVSGAPWQLYEPIASLLFSEQGGFPPGSIHMKNVRTNPFESESYKDIWTLIASGSHKTTFNQKIRQISTLMIRFPARKFILVGDSGEQDPEIYRKLRSKFGQQITEIVIRDVADAATLNPDRLKGMNVIPANLKC